MTKFRATALACLAGALWLTGAPTMSIAQDVGNPQKPALPKDDGEKRILDAIAEARQGQRYANVSDADGRLLRQLAEAVNAKRVVELGTSTGESGLYFSLALRKTGGKLYTYDIHVGTASPQVLMAKAIYQGVRP
jgi:hypothetical protein